MFCHNCGAKVEDGALFCGECGAKLNEKYEQEKRNAPENAKITPAKKANRNGAAVIVMAVIIVALAAVIAILVFRSGKDDGDRADMEPETETVSESEETQPVQVQEEESAGGEATENSGAAKTESIRIGDRSQTTGDREMMENDPEDGQYVLPDSDKRYLQETDLEGLGAEELKLARNELYARYGRRFNDEALQTYFEGKDWYEGIYSPEEFPEDLLNDIEKYNRDLIVEYEKKMGYR